MVSHKALPLFGSISEIPPFFKYLESDSGDLFIDVCIDSRAVEKGSLFVCLKGERVDGHDYIEAAVEAGAVCCLIEKSFYEKAESRIISLKNKSSFIIAENSLEYFQKLAEKYLEGFSGLLKIGVTGSSGKTTTKEIIADILSVKYSVYRNEGNLNSEIGLPLSVFGVNNSHEIAVFEMGMNREGEMDILSAVLKPHIAVITNIGDAHIGILGSRDNIAGEKKKIFKFLGNKGKAYIAENENYFDFLKQGLDAEVNKYGPESETSFKSVDDLGLDGYVLHFEEGDVNFPLYGKYNLINLFSGISVSRDLGLTFNEMKRGIENIKPLFGRSQVLRGDVTLIKDCYNANPESMTAALSSFEQIPWAGRKVLVAGSMLELGDISLDIHKRVLTDVMKKGFDLVFAFGEAFVNASESLNIVNNDKYFCSNDRGMFEQKLLDKIRKNDLVLLKGSRGMKLEDFVKNL